MVVGSRLILVSTCCVLSAGVSVSLLFLVSGLGEFENKTNRKIVNVTETTRSICLSRIRKISEAY